MALPTIDARPGLAEETAAVFRSRTRESLDVVVTREPGGWCAGLNDVWRRRRGADVFVCAGDDVVPADDGWLDPLLTQIQHGATPVPRVTDEFAVVAGDWLDRVFPLPEDLRAATSELIRARLEIGGAATAEPSFAVVIPTIGRPSLRQTLESVIVQLTARDQVFVVGDGERPLAREICADYPRPGLQYLEQPRVGDTGNSARELALARAEADFVSFMDDDDCYTPDAFAVLRRACAGAPTRPHVFRMDLRGTALWRAPELSYGDVGTPMFVPVFDRERLGRWATNDFDFICDTVALQGEPVWHEDLICVVRPHER